MRNAECGIKKFILRNSEIRNPKSEIELCYSIPTDEKLITFESR